MTRQTTDHDMLAHYSAALDEIYRLRQALAYEASVLAVHLGYASFPKSRRGHAENQVERMRQAARGATLEAYHDTSHLSLGHAAREAGVPKTLTRGEWERRYGSKELCPKEPWYDEAGCAYNADGIHRCVGEPGHGKEHQCHPPCNAMSIED